MAVVEFVRSSIVVPGLAHDEDVVATAERIGIHGNGAEVDIGVVAGGLAGRGAIEVPFWEIVDGIGLLAQSLIDGKNC